MTEKLMDHFIAIEVMGWNLSSTGKTWRNGSGEHMDRERNWRPSTEINDAFRVIKRMMQLGFWPGVQSSAHGWEATMHTDWASPFCKNKWPRDKTPAMAVCRSALQWIREPKL